MRSYELSSSKTSCTAYKIYLDRRGRVACKNQIEAVDSQPPTRGRAKGRKHGHAVRHPDGGRRDGAVSARRESRRRAKHAPILEQPQPRHVFGAAPPCRGGPARRSAVDKYIYIDLITQKERRPNTLRDRKKAEPLGKGWMRGRVGRH